MKDHLKRMRSWLAKKRGKKTRGQSLVEFTIMAPLLLIMLSGLIEFGLALNVYLDLIDTAREAARAASDWDPLGGGSYVQDFYVGAGYRAESSLLQAGQIDLPEATANDNLEIIISVFSIDDSKTVVARYPPTITDNRVGQVDYPSMGKKGGNIKCGLKTPDNNGGSGGWRYYCAGYPGAMAFSSKFSISDVQSRLNTLSFPPPATGVVLVEVYYNYYQLLSLPWLKPFVPDPIVLHAYTFAPNSASEPAE
jgi:hypothetical protein